MSRSINRLPHQPVERTLKALSGRWKALIIYHLAGGDRRFSDLLARLVGISPQVLVRQLRELEAHGVVRRTSGPRRRVCYELTELGQALPPMLAALCAWGQA